MLLVVNFVFTQDNSSLEDQFKIEFFFTGLGVSYEMPLSQKWLLDMGAGIGGGVDERESYPSVSDTPAPYFKSEFKYIYNRERRLAKGKRIENNLGNYIAVQTKYTARRFTENDIENLSYNALLAEVHWGTQSSLGGNWLFNFHIGLGILRDLDNNNGLMSPTIGLKFAHKLF